MGGEEGGVCMDPAQWGNLFNSSANLPKQNSHNLFTHFTTLRTFMTLVTYYLYVLCTYNLDPFLTYPKRSIDMGGKEGGVCMIWPWLGRNWPNGGIFFIRAQIYQNKIHTTYLLYFTTLENLHDSGYILPICMYIVHTIWILF